MGFVQAAVGAIVVYFVTKAIYNLYFHPLSRYPGPLLWRLSQLPQLVVMLQGVLPFRIKELHDKYGDVIRVGPNELSFVDSRAWKDIYPRKDFLRPPQWGARPPGVEAHNLISAPLEIHSRFRKALAPAFSEKATQEYEPTVRKYIDKLLVRLDETLKPDGDGNEEGVADIFQWLNFTTFDIIGDLSWGRAFHCLDSTKEHPFIAVLLHFKVALIATVIKHFPALDALMPYITPASALNMLHNVIKTGQQRIQERKESVAEKKDVIAYLTQYNESCVPEARMTDEEIEQNTLTIIVAGSETLTTALTGAFHYLLMENEKLGILSEEIRSTFGSEEQITGAKLAGLPYLNAVLSEALRLCPPLPDSLRRRVPKGGATIAGHTLHEGVTVATACWSQLQSASHFSEPESFAPERWLHGGPSKTFPNHDAKAFYPFSLGPHGCLGQSLAWLEMRMILALLVWRYDFSLPLGSAGEKAANGWRAQKIYWTWEKAPLLVRIRRAT
ncbi:cytochrome P450 ClCP1 [Delitschia confertaspora ATCC 74209]|uniref:Cytochrome P450 ClCP1 n=1 Tax=Delitschia confertaspora ATCC 74209 TaxID=1513339 RepID=A0A9P4JH75_9PLEO|nr:cytochrome P450 ClCP1 [Delitschia confertaspora ATCC 74209]